MVFAERVELHLVGIEKLLPPLRSSTGLSILHTLCIFNPNGGEGTPSHLYISILPKNMNAKSCQFLRCFIVDLPCLSQNIFCCKSVQFWQLFPGQVI